MAISLKEKKEYLQNIQKDDSTTKILNAIYSSYTEIDMIERRLNLIEEKINEIITVINDIYIKEKNQQDDLK